MLDIPLFIRGGYAFVSVVRDASRLDRVFNVVDAITEKPEVARTVVATYRQIPECARALDERPLLGALDMEALGQLPEGTLGRAYADFIKGNGLDPYALMRERRVETDADYVRGHLAETHDIWHVVTGFRTDLAGELGLQAFGLGQFPNRVALALLTAGLLNTLFYAFDDRDARMTQVARGWLLSRKARPFFGVDWKQLWEKPLAEVRAALGVDVDGVDAMIRTYAPATPPLRAAA